MLLMVVVRRSIRAWAPSTSHHRLRLAFSSGWRRIPKWKWWNLWFATGHRWLPSPPHKAASEVKPRFSSLNHLHGIARYCRVLHGLAWYCVDFHHSPSYKKGLLPMHTPTYMAGGMALKGSWIQMLVSLNSIKGSMRPQNWMIFFSFSKQGLTLALALFWKSSGIFPPKNTPKNALRVNFWIENDHTHPHRILP